LGFGLIFSLHIGKRDWPKGWGVWTGGFILGVFGTALPMVGIVSSLQYLSSGLTSILTSINPAITVMMAHFFLSDETLTRRKGVGVILALGGCVLLVILGENGLPNIEKVNPLGYLFVLGGILGISTMTVYARKYLGSYDTFDITGIRMFSSALVLIPVSLLFEGLDLSRVNLMGLTALFFAAIVGTFLGYLLSFYNIQRFGVSASVMAEYLIPVVAGVIGLLFMDEQITWGMICGIVLIIFGTWIINTNNYVKNIIK
jgi:drug/metabolite transporter (DMT)-like permease